MNSFQHNSSPARERILFANGYIPTRIIKMLALTLIVATAGLTILPLPDYSQELARVSDLSPAERESAMSALVCS